MYVKMTVKRLLCFLGLVVILMTIPSPKSLCQTLLDNYDGVGDLTYTTEGTWVITGGVYEGQNNSLTTPEHSIASYDISSSISGWSLGKSNENTWFGWMDANRTSISGWGSNNYSCGMVLACNKEYFNTETPSGYAVIFRNAPDELVLVKFSGDITSGSTNMWSGAVVLASSGYIYSNSDNGVNFFVEYLSDGTWKIYYIAGAQLSDVNATDKTNYSGGSAASVPDETYTGTSYKYAGWIYSHSSGSGQEAHFDNFGAGQSTTTPTSIVEAGSGSEPATISSIYDTQGEAVLNFDFKVTDDGATSGTDSDPLLINQIVISQGTGDDITSFTSVLDGALLYDGTNTQTANITINANNITISNISNSSGALGYIADNATKTYQLKIWMKSGLGSSTIEGDNFAFLVNRSSFTVETSGSSDFLTGNGTDVESGSTNNEVTVAATKLLFVQAPTTNSVDAAMSPSVTVEAVDVNGNRDEGFTSSIRITSTGTLTGTPVDLAAISGLATFNSLKHTATSTGLTLNAERTSTTDWDITSSTFDIVNTLLLDDYDGVNDLTYTMEGVWQVSADNEYEGHTDALTTPEHSYASYELTNSIAGWDLNKSNTNTWCGWMDLNRTSVSGWGSSNYSCGLVLAANNADFNSGSPTGYAVVFKNTSDLLVLVKFSGNIANGSTDLWSGTTELVSSAYTYSDSDNGVNFFVEYLSDGTWKISYKTGAQLSDANAIDKSNYSDGNATSAVDETYTGTSYNYTGWVYAHSSATGNAYFDNLGVGQEDQDTEITTSAISGSPFCVTSSTTASVTVNFTSTGTFTGGNTYTAQLSNSSGSFSAPTSIGSLVSTSNSGAISATIPAGTASGTNYRIRVIADNPSTTGSNNGTDLIIVLGPENVTGSSATSGNTQAAISWTNPATCFDAILVVGKAGGSVSATPSGDGSSYTANTVFGSGTDIGTSEYVVYKSTSSTVTVTGLTNGTNYCFKTFTRNGTTWSSGTEVCVTPTNVTTLVSGDFAVLGIDANHNGSCGGGAGDDEISFVCFKDILAGTTLDFTDNGWYRENVGQWGNTEGAIRITRSTGTVLAGVVMTLKMDASKADADDKRYEIWIGGTRDNDWDFTEINYTADFNMNSGGDQFYFMQGGTWNGGTYNDHDATYTGGNILFGFSTTSSWVDAGLSSTKSGLYENKDCYSMAPTSSTDYDKYTGPVTGATQREWILRVNDKSNWTSYSNCSDYEDASPDYVGGLTLTINSGSFTNGEWVGDTDSDWFNCRNWKSLALPDVDTDVLLPSGGGIANEPTIDSAGVVSKDFEIQSGRTLTIATSGGNTGTLTIAGDFTNAGTLTHTAGSVTFNGSSSQSLTSTVNTDFYRLRIKNTSSTGVSLAGGKGITVSDSLNLIDGILYTSSSQRCTLASATKNSAGVTASHIEGPVVKKIGSTVQWIAPIGEEGRLMKLGLKCTGSPNSYFTTEAFNDPYTDLDVDASHLNNISSIEYWSIDRNSGSDNPTIRLYWDASSVVDLENLSDLSTAHYDGTTDWDTANFANMNINTTDNYIEGDYTGSYSPFTLGSKSSSNNPLPITLIEFSAIVDGLGVKLNWTTSTEINNDYFTIERSSNGVDFEGHVLSTIDGAGNSTINKHYQIYDENPLSGTSYYRLKQTDFDGNFEYFAPVTVTFNSGEIGLITIRTNPFYNTATIRFNAEKNDMTTLMIYNAFGQMIMGELLKTHEGINDVTIDLNGYSKGVYVFQLENQRTRFLSSKLFLYH